VAQPLQEYLKSDSGYPNDVGEERKKIRERPMRCDSVVSVAVCGDIFNIYVCTYIHIHMMMMIAFIITFGEIM